MQGELLFGWQCTIAIDVIRALDINFVPTDKMTLYNCLNPDIVDIDCTVQTCTTMKTATENKQRLPKESYDRQLHIQKPSKVKRQLQNH